MNGTEAMKPSWLLEVVEVLRVLLRGRFLRYALAGAIGLAAVSGCGSGSLSGRMLAGGDPRLADGAEVDRVLTGYGETSAPLWMPEGYLLFTDLASDTVYLWNEPQRPIVFRKAAGWPVSHERDSGGRIVTARLDRRVTWTQVGGRVSALADTFDGRKLNGPVDVALGPEGAVYFVDAESVSPRLARLAAAGAKSRPSHARKLRAEQAGAGIYRVGDDREARLVGRLPGSPNGIAFSPDFRWLFVTDATDGGVHRCAVRRDGSLGEPERFVTMRAGSGEDTATSALVVHPATGTLFVCGPGGVWMIAPEGRAVGRLPVDDPATGVALGGLDGRSLFITAGSSIYRVRLRHSATSSRLSTLFLGKRSGG